VEVWLRRVAKKLGTSWPANAPPISNLAKALLVLLPAPGGGKELKAHVEKYKTDVASLIASFHTVGVGADVASAVHAACSTTGAAKSDRALFMVAAASSAELHAGTAGGARTAVPRAGEKPAEPVISAQIAHAAVLATAALGAVSAEVVTPLLGWQGLAPARAAGVGGSSRTADAPAAGRACGRCGGTVEPVSAMVVDRTLCCDRCYGSIGSEANVERVDVRLGVGPHTRTIAISMRSASAGTRELKVLEAMRLWESARLTTCPDDHLVIGKRVQAEFPIDFGTLDAEARKTHLAAVAPAMAAHHALYSELGDAVFELLDEQKARAGEMYDDMYHGGIRQDGDVRFIGIEVVYVQAPAPLQPAHDDCVRARTLQFAVLCSASDSATRYYHFDGDGRKYLRDFRALTYGNRGVDDDQKFEALLGQHGDLAAVTMELAGPGGGRVLDRPLFPEGQPLVPGHAWGFADVPLTHAGPPLDAMAKAGEDGRPLDRCLVVASCHRDTSLAVTDHRPDQRQGVSHLAALGFDQFLFGSVRMQAELRASWFTTRGHDGLADLTGRKVSAIPLLLNPLSATAPSCPTTEATHHVIESTVQDATSCDQPRRPHPLVAVYKGRERPVFAHAHYWDFKPGSRFSWGHAGAKYLYEVVIMETCPAEGLLMEPEGEENVKCASFRVYAGDVLVILPGFRCTWVTDHGPASKLYSYFNEYGELKGGAGDNEGHYVVTCEGCGSDCWLGSFRITAKCAAALDMPHVRDATGADLCPRCRTTHNEAIRAGNFKPTRQRFGRLWREPADRADSDRYFPQATSAAQASPPTKRLKT
jgi:hypothetical protein